MTAFPDLATVLCPECGALYGKPEAKPCVRHRAIGVLAAFDRLTALFEWNAGQTDEINDEPPAP